MPVEESESRLFSLPCGRCGEMLAGKSDDEIRRHVGRHTEIDLRFLCNVCNTKFCESSLLIQHKMHAKHDVMSLATCDVCKKKFSTRLGEKLHTTLLHTTASQK